MALLGQKVSNATKLKMREAAKRRIIERPWTIPSSKGIKRPGWHPPNYKGDKVSYSGLHHWLKYHLGKPSKCENCGLTKSRYEWANVSGEYLRDLDDWVSLCVICHRLVDDTGKKAWLQRKPRPA